MIGTRRLLRFGKRGERRRAAGGLNVDVSQIARRLAEGRIDLEHDAVLVQLREHDRNLPLAERVVERVVDQLRRHAEPRGRVAVDHDLNLPTLELLVAGHVAKLRQFLELFDEPRRPDGQFLRPRVLEAVLVLRAAHARFDRQVLNGLHEQADAVNLIDDRLQPADDGAGIGVPFVERLQIDLNSARVERRVRPVDSDEGRQAFDGRILQNGLGQRLLPGRHGREGNVLRRVGNPHDHARVLHGEESLRRDHVEVHGPDERADGDQQCQELVPQDDRQGLSVKGDDRFEHVFRRAIEPALLVDSGLCLSSRAAIIGVSVSETTAEKRIVTLNVTANSRNNRPTMSPMNNSGINTAISEILSEIIVKPISADPLSAACSGFSPCST